MEKQYSIGLDIGTASVGWAVIDSDFKIMNGKTYRYEYNSITKKYTRKTKIKPLWGVRLFEEADTAEDRRSKRGTRRRYDRRRKRIKLLQEEFKEEINKVDKDFLKKLKDSFYSKEDKFNQKIELTDEDKRKIFSNYVRNNGVKKEFPTIYHLRYALMNSHTKMDIRQVYLGVHHIIKYRGNFLYGSEFNTNKIDIKNKIKEAFEEYDNLVMMNSLNLESLNDDMCKKIEEILFQKSKIDIRKNLEKEIKKIVDDNSKTKELVKLLLGDKFNLLKLFDVTKKEDSVESISFKGNDYDTNIVKLEILLEEKIDVLNNFKDLYDLLFIKTMFKGSKATTISELMIEYYNKHEEDLKLLKKTFRQNKIVYNKIFRNKDCLYDKYISNNIEYTKFKNELKNLLDEIPEKEIISNIKEQLDNEKFLPRITSTDNGKYPYQLNLKELKQIIENQGKYYPFLKNTIIDEYGNNVYKIEKLLTFRIPYYVGPLNNQTCKKGILSANAWLIRKNENITEPITPYNFHNIIDKEKTAEKFIERMISKCTYINNVNAMPINSIYYSKYKVISELKQISVNNMKLTKEHILDIYNDLFLKKENINKNDLEQYLRNHIDYKFYSEYDIKGFQGNDKFASNMKSYIDFFGNEGIFEGTNYKETDAESIIRDVTIFEDKELLKNRLERNYHKLTENKIKKIINLKYKGWSSISKELLDTKFYQNQETKEYKSIMDLMLETNQNFMQIINNKKYKIQEQINKLNNIEKKDKIDYELIKDLATSPKNKRAIYQALKVVEEIINYMGYNPDNISIEMARSDGEKTRASSRKEQLQKIYKDLSHQIDNYNGLIVQLNDIEEKELDKEKVFLYFLQCGKSLYSMKPLPLEDLDKFCEVDHIIPQTLIKDDSIDNKALVFKEENQSKRDSYVLPKEFRSDMKKWWNKLNKIDKKLMSNKKLFALTRETFTEDQIEGFINRQLVETRQICKHVANILHTYYKKTNIIYLHANLSSNYRKKFKLYKFRDLNDYHHAHDAYLAVCLGIYQEKYINKKINFEELKKLSKKFYDEKKYKELNYGYIINSLDNSVINVDKETKKHFDNEYFNALVEETLYRNDIMVTKKTEFKTGKMYDETKKSKGNPGIRLKKNLDTNLYGSYTKVNPSYAVVVKYNKNGKILQKMIGVPILIDVFNDEKLLSKYIEDKYKMNIVGYILDRNNNILKIPFFTKMSWNNQICMLVGASDKVEVCNAKEFRIDRSSIIKYKQTLDILLNRKGKMPKDYDSDKYICEIGEILDYIGNKMIKEYDLYFNLCDELKEIINESKSNLEYTEKAISELLHLLKVNSKNAAFKHINHSSAFGKKNERIIEHATLIKQSYTGIKEECYEF